MPPTTFYMGGYGKFVDVSFYKEFRYLSSILLVALILIHSPCEHTLKQKPLMHEKITISGLALTQSFTNSRQKFSIRFVS